MSVNPVPSFEYASGAESSKAEVQPMPVDIGVGSEKIPDPGQSPEVNKPQPAPASASLELPEDEVQVQRDSSSGEIIIRYLDGRGDVILQVPSEQLLNLAHAAEHEQNSLSGPHSSKLGEGASQGGRIHGN